MNLRTLMDFRFPEKGNPLWKKWNSVDEHCKTV